MRIIGFVRKWFQFFVRPAPEHILSDILQHSTAHLPVAAQMQWLEQLLLWLFKREEDRTEVRFRYLFQTLEKNPAWKSNLQNTITSILDKADFLDLFTSTGLAVERGLWGDIADRIRTRLIPRGGNGRIQELFSNVIDSEELVQQVRNLPAEVLIQLHGLLYHPQSMPAWDHLNLRAREALLFLSIHTAHYGIGNQIQKRLPPKERGRDQSFLELAAATRAGHVLKMRELISACEQEVAGAYASMESTGVSIDIVNRLETISALLNRARHLLPFFEPQTVDQVIISARTLMVDVLSAGIQRRSLVGYLRNHFYLLSRKIVERNGNSAEHYIARTRSELRALFWSAIGGGMVVVLMTVLKTWVQVWRPAPLFKAMEIWLIYSSGFLAMQFLGLTLATKIPSFTASRLATLLKARKNPLAEFREEFRLVLKSQSVALLGNVVGLIPLALLVHYAFVWVQGTGLMGMSYAHHVLWDLNPFISFAVLLGALTGMELWLSSVAGGWFENWIVFNAVPSAIENHFRFRTLFGEKAAKRLADWWLQHSSGMATNITLGFLFAFVPLLGALFRADWNGHHVTISTTGAVFAAAAQGFTMEYVEVLFLLLGLTLVGLMNFAVSFGLALYVAANAQKMKFKHVLIYLRAALSRKSH